jgi:hypothetical protein
MRTELRNSGPHYDNGVTCSLEASPQRTGSSTIALGTGFAMRVRLKAIRMK